MSDVSDAGGDAGDDRRRWFPIAALADLTDRHVLHAQLLDHELAVWRADDGTVNVWENRCPHRGVRLTLGSHDGTELTCRYHGWRYASGSAQCTHLPAHPEQTPTKAMCAATFPVRVVAGLVWSGLEPDGEPEVPDGLGDDPVVLRALPFDVPAAVVSAALGSLPGAPSGAATWFVQPLDEARCVVRGLLVSDRPGDARREQHELLDGLRRRVEATGAREPRRAAANLRLGRSATRRARGGDAR